MFGISVFQILVVGLVLVLVIFSGPIFRDSSKAFYSDSLAFLGGSGLLIATFIAPASISFLYIQNFDASLYIPLSGVALYAIVWLLRDWLSWKTAPLFLLVGHLFRQRVEHSIYGIINGDWEHIYLYWFNADIYIWNLQSIPYQPYSLIISLIIVLSFFLTTGSKDRLIRNLRLWRLSYEQCSK